MLLKIDKTTPPLLPLGTIGLIDEINTLFDEKVLAQFIGEYKDCFKKYGLTPYQIKIVILCQSGWKIFRNGEVEDETIKELKPLVSYLTFGKIKFLRVNEKSLSKLFEKCVFEYIDDYDTICCHIAIPSITRY